MTDAPPPSYTDTAGAAAYLNLAPSTLDTWRSQGRGPAYSKLGTAVRYSYADLDAFASANKQEPTSE